MEPDATEATVVSPRGRRYADRPHWERRYRVVALVGDLIAVVAAIVIAKTVRFGGFDAGRSIGGRQFVLLATAWLVLLGLGGAYDVRRVGSGFDEYRSILRACFRLFAVLAIVLYLAESNISRGYVAVLLPTLAILTLLMRKLARRMLHRLRDSGRAMSHVLAVGTTANVRAMTLHLDRIPWAGYRVIGACVPAHSGGVQEVPTFETTCADDVLDALQRTGADVLAVTDITAVPLGTLQALSWQLEGSGVELVVAPAVTDIAGPRITIRPVAGLPLLHVEEPRLEGISRWLKHTVDRGAAAVGLIFLAPLFAVFAVLIKLTSPGPVFFRQVRVGKDGRDFVMVKFRTMVVGAVDEVDDLQALNESHGPMFKIRRDPRITGVGGVLRRLSIDELPQLVNVLRGQMSVVGPRPPLPCEVAQYGDDMRRRFLVRPGLTGLWQVSGRSDLPWEETVRLDLHYVDNWSPSLDLLILAKTVHAVVRGIGAY